MIESERKQIIDLIKRGDSGDRVYGTHCGSALCS